MKDYLTDIQVTSNGQIDLLYAYDDALNRISKGALKKEVIDTVYKVMDRRFNKLMDAEFQRGESSIRHMYEWKASPGNPAHKLWFTKLHNDTVVFYFRQSRQQVPIDPRLENVKSKDHVFKRKAEVFEKALPVHIKPKSMKFLRWYDDRPGGNGESLVAGKNPAQNTVYAYESEIDNPGGGQFRNEFTNKFAIFWATAGVNSEAELSRVLQGSKYFRGDVANSLHRKQTIKSLRKMRGTQRAIISNGRNGQEAKRLAKEMIAEIEKDLRHYGAE